MPSRPTRTRPPPTKRHGLLIVYTGDGKGKTTAALGLALRVLGHKEHVCIIHFIKGGWKCGELSSLARFKKRLTCRVMGCGFTWQSRDISKDIAAARSAWQYALRALISHRYGMVILDELTYLMKYRMVSTREIVAALRQRRPGLHAVITGRDAPLSLIRAADLVTEMREVKHPYNRGTKAQPGIEF